MSALVSSIRAWYAHVSFAVLAAAYLAATRTGEHARDHKGDLQPAATG
ncbi:hypothetical protein [Pseudonocardia sp. H11422]|nr:hypothetical protein [Pseudonocardia sp. H11422]